MSNAAHLNVAGEYMNECKENSKGTMDKWNAKKRSDEAIQNKRWNELPSFYHIHTHQCKVKNKTKTESQKRRSEEKITTHKSVIL